ncbi:stAR-related lipid transfer protein 5-like [Oncorhynchus masou masou]|uniref:stAR-related lipid transfer protein 5-like n=1 Tax=Oncorhynchus masou masou TaxID=90313 RepID=UPI003183AB28
MDYQNTANAVGDCLLSYTKDESGWKVCKKSNDVIVSWRPSTEFPGNVYKGESVVKGSPEKVWECLKPVPNGLRVKWDNNVKKFELVEQVTENVTVCRTVTPSAAMGIIAPRDFVDVILVKQYEDGTITSNATHVNHPNCPPQSGYVRGFNHPVAASVSHLWGAKQNTAVQFLPDGPGGFLPRSVVDSFFPSSMVEFYSNLAKAIKSFKDH